MGQREGLKRSVVEDGTGRHVDLWAIDGERERHVQLDVYGSMPVELSAEVARDLRDWLTEWLGETTGRGATLFESTEPPAGATPCRHCGYLEKSHGIPEASGECPRFETDESELSNPDEKRLGPFARESGTSRQAALAAYPRQGTQRWRIIQELERTDPAAGPPGATRQELARALGISENTVRPRVVELIEGGWLRTATTERGEVRTRKTTDGQDAEVLVLTSQAQREIWRRVTRAVPDA